MTRCEDVCATTTGTVVLEDGRVIWETPFGDRERTLTPAGLALVRDRLDATGLLSENSEHRATLLPGAVPEPRGATVVTFALERDGRRIVVTSGDPSDYAREFDLWTIPPGMLALASLAAEMRDPVTWLGRDAWATPEEPFEPDRFLLSVTAVEGTPRAELTIDIGDLEWPFSIPPESLGSRQPAGEAADGTTRCIVLTAGEARAMATAEAAAGRGRALKLYEVTLEYAWARGEGFIRMTTQGLLPYQSSDCIEALSW